MDVKKIGERIKHARSLRNYTLEDIAKDIGVAKSTIQRYERGQIAHPKLPVLHSIANSLNVNPGWLVGKDINMNADMDTKYSKYISDSTMIFEITGRSLKNSPTVFQAICDSLSEMCEGVDNTTKVHSILILTKLLHLMLLLMSYYMIRRMIRYLYILFLISQKMLTMSKNY